MDYTDFWNSACNRLRDARCPRATCPVFGMFVQLNNYLLMFCNQIMQSCINRAIPIFDQLEEADDAWNVYQYMVKLASTAVAKVVLGMDFDHFAEVDSPLHPMVRRVQSACAGY